MTCVKRISSCCSISSEFKAWKHSLTLPMGNRRFTVEVSDNFNNGNIVVSKWFTSRQVENSMKWLYIAIWGAYSLMESISLSWAALWEYIPISHLSPSPPLEKLEKLEIYQNEPTISDFRQLEKIRKKLEVSGAAFWECTPISPHERDNNHHTTSNPLIWHTSDPRTLRY